MRFFKPAGGIGLICGALLIAGMLSPGVRASDWNDRTIVTFSGPVEVPGVKEPEVLPAGTYTFKLLNSQSDRNIVEILNKNQTHLYAIVLAIPDYHLRPRGKTLIKLYNSKNGNPAALKAWFYPGDNFGQRFVYPKSRATEIAKDANEPVPSMPDETAANMSKPIKSGNEPAASALKNANVKAEEPSGQEVAASQAVQSQPSNSSSNAKP
ncbi:MAG: hypothetical protein WBR26_27045 [Candidatus Acidiferrum sp.]